MISWENFWDIKKKDMIERMAWAKVSDCYGQIFTECSIFWRANRCCQYCFLCTMWVNLKQIYLHTIQTWYGYDLHVPSNSFSNCWQVVYFTGTKLFINPLMPNDPYSGRTAPLTSKHCILCIYSTNVGTEYFKHGLYSPFFFLFKMQFVS